MTNETANGSLEKKIHAFCVENKPICPPEALMKAGQHIIKIAKELLNIEANKERYVSVEHCVLDIMPHIDKLIAAQDPSGHALGVGYEEVLVINLLFIELLSDLTLFQKKTSKETCIYFLSKYSRLLAAVRNSNTAHFYNWLYNQYEDDANFDYRAQLTTAGAGFFFVLMHEWTHKQPGLIESTSALFLSSIEFQKIEAEIRERKKERIRKSAPSLDEETIEDKTDALMTNLMLEVCCDFTALAMTSEYGYEKEFNCSKTELVSISMLALFIEAIYDVLSAICLNESFENGKTKLDNLSIILDERIRLLAAAVKISCNGNMFFGDCNIQTALSFVKEAIVCLLREIAEFYLNEITPKIAQYNSMSDEERDRFTFLYQHFEWNIIA